MAQVFARHAYGIGKRLRDPLTRIIRCGVSTTASGPFFEPQPQDTTKQDVFKIENIPDNSNIHIAECVEKVEAGKDLYKLTFLTADHHKTKNKFNFIPGQWIDMFIPAMETVGGFSITSTPKKLPYFDLAVQKTNHPPTLWLAEECKVGDVVSIRSGGTFYWDKSFDKKKVMLVAGGIGINPLFSILSEVKNMLEENGHSPLDPPKVSLLYSIKSAQSALFDRNIVDFAKQYPECIHVTFKLTENIDININNTVFDSVEASRSTHASNIKISKNRLNDLDFENALEFLDDDTSDDVNEDVACYICGPPTFVDHYERVLQNKFDIDDTRVERWW